MTKAELVALLADFPDDEELELRLTGFGDVILIAIQSSNVLMRVEA